jgi:DNA-binding transcriptional LysR family regulator
MTDLDLRHLVTLAAVVEEGSFGRAASRLGYTQSSVSQHIAGLERAVGGRLFDRPPGPRRPLLTPLGEVVRTHAVDLLAKADALHAAVDRFRAGQSRLTIGTFQSVSSTLLPAMVHRLRDEFPGCDIRLREEEPQSPDLAEVDLLLYDLRTDDPAVDQRKLLDDPYYLVAPRGQFPDGPVDLAELDGLAMVAWPPDCAQPALEEALARSGVRPDIVFRAAANEAVLALVRAGLGAAVLPWLAIHGTGAATDGAVGIHALRPPVAHREIHLMRHAHRTPSPLAARAAQLIVEIADDLPRSPSIPPPCGGVTAVTG